MTVVDLDHSVALNVILEALELEVEDGREGEESDALLGVLQAIALSLVFVLAIEGLDLNVILEGLIQVLHALHIELEVLRGLSTI